MTITNNNDEKCFNRLSPHSAHHPNPYKLVDCLLSENVRADFLWFRLKGGDVPVLYGDVSAREENLRLLNVTADYK